MNNHNEGENIQNLRHEDEIEEEANSRTGLLRNVRVASNEWTRFLLFGSMFFIIGFIYSFMRILKDMFVMERQDPNCFNFIKICYILPLSFGVVVLINYLLQSKTISKIFTIFLVIFAVLFILFGSILPFEKDILDLTYLKKTYGKSNNVIKYFMYTLAEPMATLIYISAELWGSIMLSYLYLSYLNESCTFRQHSRFIPPLFILINFALFTSALVTSAMRYFITKLKNKTRTKLLMMSGIFFLEGIMVLGVLLCKYYLEKRVLNTPLFIPRRMERSRRPKPRLSMKESFNIMKKSKFLISMCGIVFFFNVMANLLETVYKLGIKESATQRNMEASEYSAKLNNYDQYITSLVVIGLNLTSFSNITNTMGWLFTSLISPSVAIFGVVFILGLGTYNSATEENSFSFINSMFSGRTAFYTLENYGGMLVMAGIKIFKYTSFDVTKEKISMRIEERYRPKFKSIYDGIFNKVGKSGGSVYSIMANAVFKDISPRGIAPITLLFSSGFIFVWIILLFYLGANYNKSINNQKPIEIDLFNEEDEEESEKEEGEIKEGERINERPKETEKVKKIVL